jgi:putative Holliday junction resolvase
MRIIGLDVGTKTVGVALSDPLCISAGGLETVKIDYATNNLGFKRLGEIIKEYEVERIVVGLPLHMNGDHGKRADASKEYGARLEARFSLPVEFVDERLTTAESHRVLREAGMHGSKRKEVIDQLAAVLILQQYLETRRGK